MVAPDDSERPHPQSGYTACPCCGYDTISSDMTTPELCGDCEEAGCDPGGEEPLCPQSDAEWADPHDAPLGPEHETDFEVDRHEPEE